MGMDLLITPQGLPYAIALTVMVMLIAVEIINVLMGLGISEALDSLLPDGFDADIDFEVDAGPAVRFFDWLYVGRVPILVLAICFLLAFGLIGFGILFVSTALLGWQVPALLSVPFAFAGALPIVRVQATVISALIPQDESSAVRSESLVGSLGVITLGQATREMAAETRVVDESGQDHYIRVIPQKEGETFKQGSNVLVVTHLGDSRFEAIEAPPHLL